MRTILRSAGASVAGLAMIGALALPAAALTDSGTITCTSGATVGVRGEQQRFADRLTLYAAGQKVYQSYNVYVAGGDSGTYGRCIPPHV